VNQNKLVYHIFMKSIREQRELLNKVMTLLERHLGPKCEAVLHDLTGDYGSSIVDIRNGHITNRKIGDSGSNLGLEVLRGAAGEGDQFNYIAYTRDNKVLRSSSVYFRGDDGRVIGALCLNLDITQSLLCEEFLHQLNQFPLGNAGGAAGDGGLTRSASGDRALPENSGARDSANPAGGEAPEPPVKEVFVNSVRELLDYLIGEAAAQAGKTVSQMKLADKLQFVRFLDRKGAFLITRSGDAVCEFLRISKYTLYRYLEIVRGKEGEPPSGPPAAI
jgi:predicted transcriptional regulator YheO